jgi:hypothetical protein
VFEELDLKISEAKPGISSGVFLSRTCPFICMRTLVGCPKTA